MLQLRRRTVLGYPFFSAINPFQLELSRLQLGPQALFDRQGLQSQLKVPIVGQFAKVFRLADAKSCTFRRDLFFNLLLPCNERQTRLHQILQTVVCRKTRNLLLDGLDIPSQISAISDERQDGLNRFLCKRTGCPGEWLRLRINLQRPLCAQIIDSVKKLA